MDTITECAAYAKLLALVEDDERRSPGFHDYHKKLRWVVGRVQHYAEKTGVPAVEILTAWESRRTYWYMNYYQDAKQPLLTAPNVRVFDTSEAMRAAIGEMVFRCPRCQGASTDPYECNTGQEMSPGKVCDWKSWGLFGTMGRGVFVFVKEQMAGEHIFMPISWESQGSPVTA